MVILKYLRLLASCMLGLLAGAAPALTAAEAVSLDRMTAAHIAASSYANVAQVRTRHIALDLTADFARKRLHGTVELEIERVSPHTRELVLDTKDLRISSVELSDASPQWRRARYGFGGRDPVLGTPLRIELLPSTTRVRIRYATQPGASGLQWLDPTQTAGKKRPFLYSQSQPIHARTWIPLQDTPFSRVTYDARVRVPKGLRPVMSAEMHDEPDESGAWAFRMSQPIPPYLIALAVGDIAFGSLGARTGVYAEPSVLQKALFEFADTEHTLELMERTFGPYRWGRYDILVLPPSFPFGGMENPRLTFASPTVITGDRMLVSLVSHELAHSWAGNLVTNVSWNDFWLNEGFTQFLTYRVLEMQFGKTRADMERARGLEELRQTMAQIPRSEWPLVRSTPAKDPDRELNSVPYERGALFLTWLEAQTGLPEFDVFLRGWFDDHAFQSVSTRQFIAYLNQKLHTRRAGDVTGQQVDAWLYMPELPSFAVLPHSDALAKVDALRDAWLQGRTGIDALPGARWTVQEWEQFLGKLPETLTREQARLLDERFNLSASSNAIIASAWFRVAISAGYKPAYPGVARYLLTVGRLVLITPLYAQLSRSTEGKAFARKIYARAKRSYHPITRAAIGRLLNE